MNTNKKAADSKKLVKPIKEEVNTCAVKASKSKPVSEKEIESEIDRINPDENSMESRG